VLAYFAHRWGAIFAGGAHTLGLYQGIDVWLGQDGICVPLPNPTPGGPFCYLMSIHILLVVPMGWCFIYMVYVEVKHCGSYFHWTRFTAPDSPSVLYRRAALYFTTIGLSDIGPYIGEMIVHGDVSSVLWAPGLYSGRAWLNRAITPALTEFIAGCSLFLGGLYFIAMASMGRKSSYAYSSGLLPPKV